MLFNSIEFIFFLPIVFFCYWFVVQHNLKLQNAFIVLASYLFYGWWDWRFLFLIFFSTAVDFFVGIGLNFLTNKRQRKFLLVMSIIVNLALLGCFKYFNFFIDSFVTAFSFFGSNIKINSLNIILPVGISFYTFQTMSYSIDVYRYKINPTNDFIAFAAFVSFFPQLVAGPIERATHLLPQITKKRSFDYLKAVDGLRQILWGLFKKLVIADNCAEYANFIFANSDSLNGSSLIMGALFYTFQIYGDFSGYSDIAIGVSRLFGIDLKKNFAFPYFSRNIAEFYRRWHISLATWLRDYVYIPLGGSKGSIWLNIRNVFIIFIISGIWHGADWKFVIWGLLNALFFLPLLLSNKNRNFLNNAAEHKLFPNFKEFIQICSTFVLIVIARIFFRANSVNHAINILNEVFSISTFALPQYQGLGNSLSIILLIVFFLFIEWFGREQEFAIAKLGFKWHKLFRWSFYVLILFLIGVFMETKENPFIYFQF